jgi:16S rRNA (cytidine1402-2'-O)-methyltransferase
MYQPHRSADLRPIPEPTSGMHLARVFPHPHCHRTAATAAISKTHILGERDFAVPDPVVPRMALSVWVLSWFSSNPCILESRSSAVARTPKGIAQLPDTFLSPQLEQKISIKLHDQEHRPGLYVVATPIGNICDMTFRAVHILRNSKIIFAEDTRLSKKLLNFYDIRTPLMACHEHNETARHIEAALERSAIYSLISDAGTPLISDPGYRLINFCIKNDIEVHPVPGSCSLVAAISCAGIASNRFTFFGFLPGRSHARRNTIASLAHHQQTMIFFESPNRLAASLRDMLETWGDRSCCICRELTKIFEEFRRGRLSEMIDSFATAGSIIGECVLIVAGASKEPVVAIGEDATLLRELRQLLETVSTKSAAKILSEKYGFSRGAVYKKALQIKRRDCKI